MNGQPEPTVQPRTLQMPQLPSIAISNGAEVIIFTDDYDGSKEACWLRPVRKAAVVAQLRALADELERAETR